MGQWNDSDAVLWSNVYFDRLGMIQCDSCSLQNLKILDDQTAEQFTLVKSSRIYTGQYTFPILLLNDDNMLGEHKGR